MKISNQRLCVLSKTKYPKDSLIKITYIKKNNLIVMNDKNNKGRSVYFKKELLNNKKIHLVTNILMNRLRLEKKQNYIETIESYLKKVVF